MAPLFLFLLLAISISAAEKPWSARHSEGWAWYHDRVKQEDLKEQKQQNDPISDLKTVKEELERALAKAVLDPTQENVIAYMAMQQRLVNQSAFFAKQWQHALLARPDLSSLTPTTQYGVQVKKEVDSKMKETLIKTLAAKNTLLFFYEGKNAYSKAFANIVRAFAKQYNWTVQAVAVDGTTLKIFPQSIRDKNVAAEMEVSTFPCLFTVDISTLKAVPIAFGMVTVHQIEENILLQFKENP